MMSLAASESKQARNKGRCFLEKFDYEWHLDYSSVIEPHHQIYLIETAIIVMVFPNSAKTKIVPTTAIKIVAAKSEITIKSVSRKPGMSRGGGKVVVDSKVVVVDSSNVDEISIRVVSVAKSITVALDRIMK